MPLPRWFFLTLGTGAALIPIAHAQKAVVVGVVTDTAGRPLGFADVVALKSKRSATTDPKGQFLVSGLPKGKELFQVRLVGFQAQVFELELAARDTVRVEISLARDTVQQMPELSVRADAPPKPIEVFRQELKDRLLRSGAPPSALISREELVKSADTRILRLLAVHGLRIMYDKRTAKEYLSCPRGSGRPAIYVDGALADGGPTGPSSVFRGGSFAPLVDLANFIPDQVEAIEVYKTPAERPPEYNASGAYCTVALWTRRGR